MTLVAGIFCRRGHEVPVTLEQHLATGISRNSSHPRIAFRRTGCFVVSVDIGAFDPPGTHDDPQRALTVVCGDPILKTPSHTVDQQASLLHAFCRDSAWERLLECDGVYSLVNISPDGSRLVLAADHLGVRPLYYARTPEWFVFSSVFRLFDNLPGFRKTIDLQGVTEFAALDYALGSRTTYAEVSRIQPSEVIEVGPDLEAKARRYFRWDKDIRPMPNREGEVASAYDLFRRAVTKRLSPAASEVAFLSGGLDSRAVVSLLRHQGADVRTFNFPIPGEQDEAYARMFAQEAGTVHKVIPRQKPVSLWDAGWSRLLRSALVAPESGTPVNGPVVAWSGDGGSVGVGGVYLSTKLDEYFLDGDPETAARIFAPVLPQRALVPDARRRLPEALVEGIAQELRGISQDDPIRRFYLFLLLNDQRRHLDGHFEHIDLHEIEFRLPFFDAAFLKWIAGIPTSRLRRHEFYHRWIECFPAVARSVPWQTYPGHLPCPVESAKHFPAQWDRSLSVGLARVRRRRRVVQAKQLASMAASRRFPHDVVDRKRLVGAGLATVVGLREYGHIIDFSYALFRHFRHTDVPQLE